MSRKLCKLTDSRAGVYSLESSSKVVAFKEKVRVVGKHVISPEENVVHYDNVQWLKSCRKVAMVAVRVEKEERPKFIELLKVAAEVVGEERTKETFFVLHLVPCFEKISLVEQLTARKVRYWIAV